MAAYQTNHILGLPLEIRDAIYDHLTEDIDTLHLWDKEGGLHLSAAKTPPLALLQTHPTLCHEALVHFYRKRRITLHVDAYAFACLRQPETYSVTLKNCHYLQNTRALDLRPTLNASSTFLADAMEAAVPVLLSPAFSLKEVTVTWAESTQHPLSRNFRPWVYKKVALQPLWDLVGCVKLTCGGVINAPPAAADAQNQEFKRFMDRLTQNEELYKDGKGDYQSRAQIFGDSKVE